MKYFALTTIDHNGKRYGRGDAIELPEAQVTQLIEADAIQAEPVADAPALAAPAPKQAEPEATVGGEPAKSGEPSLDGRDDTSTRTEAKDVTPQISEDMTRAELEEAAVKLGIDEKEASGAPNKKALIEMIEERKLAATASAGSNENMTVAGAIAAPDMTPSVPPTDPSANL